MNLLWLYKYEPLRYYNGIGISFQLNPMQDAKLFHLRVGMIKSDPLVRDEEHGAGLKSITRP